MFDWYFYRHVGRWIVRVTVLNSRNQPIREELREQEIKKASPRVDPAIRTGEQLTYTSRYWWPIRLLPTFFLEEYVGLQYFG